MAHTGDEARTLPSPHSDNKSDHFERLLTTQSQLLNAQAHATESFGQAIRNLNLSVQDLNQRFGGFSQQLNDVDQKVETALAPSCPTENLKEDIYFTLNEIRTDLQRHNKSEHKFREIAEHIQSLKDGMGKIETHLVTEKTEDETSAEDKTEDIQTLPEFDYGKGRLQRMMVGFEGMMSSLSQDIKVFQDLTVKLEQQTTSDLSSPVGMTENTKPAFDLSFFETRFKGFETHFQELKQILNQEPQQGESHNSINSLPEFDYGKGRLQRMMVGFEGMMRSLSQDVKVFQDLVEKLEQNASSDVALSSDQPQEAMAGAMPQQSYFDEHFNSLDTHFVDLKKVLHQDGPSIEKEHANAMLASAPAVVEQQSENIEDLPLFDPKRERYERLLVGFQLLLREIKTLTEDYRGVIDEIKPIAHSPVENQPQPIDDISQKAITSLSDIEQAKTRYERFVVGLNGVLSHLADEAKQLQHVRQNITDAASAVGAVPQKADAQDWQQGFDQKIDDAVRLLSENITQAVGAQFKALETRLMEGVSSKLPQILQELPKSDHSQLEQHTAKNAMTTLHNGQSSHSLGHVIEQMHSYAAKIENSYSAFQNKIDEISTEGQPVSGDTFSHEVQAVALADPLKNTILQMQQQTGEFLAIAAALCHELEDSRDNSELEESA
ncbi:MAG: hypothetical protein AAF228_12930 [Pseudomonadota bacterium]